MRKILIIGASSAIAEATARLWAVQGHALYLVARNPDRLEAITSDLQVRGVAKIASHALDLNEVNQHPAMIERVFDQLGGLDTVLIAHGTLSDQPACEQSTEQTLRELQTNALSTIALLTLLANRFAKQGYGTLAVISSVAGDRGRATNYVYGSAKAALTTFLSGLRQRLCHDGIHVLTIKPGFVDTPMTAHIEKKGLLWAKPEQVATGIVNAVESQKNVVYLPWFWRFIMGVILHIPESLFKKLRF